MFWGYSVVSWLCQLRCWLTTQGKERAYARPNFRTKKALKEAVANGDDVGVYNIRPGGMERITNGRAVLEGPHYPEPHRWYAGVDLEDGKIVKVD